MPIPIPSVASCLVVKDTFWAMADEMPLGALIQFESADEEDHYVDQMNPPSMIRMRIEKVEVLWSNLRFESKTQNNQ